MFGCCGFESQKFRTTDGTLDEARLDALLDRAMPTPVFADPGDEVASALLRDFRAKKAHQRTRLANCRCPCHHDGMQVMC